nr:hypothetical protein [uncultured Celeribacter sp.]
MKYLPFGAAALTAVALAACVTSDPVGTTSAANTATDQCGASKYRHLVGGPSSATIGLDIPDNSRHYGREERVATDKPSRLNFVHSGTAVESVTNPGSKVVAVFCG